MIPISHTIPFGIQKIIPYDTVQVNFQPQSRAEQTINPLNKLSSLHHLHNNPVVSYTQSILILGILIKNLRHSTTIEVTWKHDIYALTHKI